MRLVGLTGGVATGKSTVARQLAEELKFAVVDADQVARWVVEPGRPAYRAVRAAFGDAFFLQDGRLNREKLGRHIFADATYAVLRGNASGPRGDETVPSALLRIPESPNPGPPIQAKRRHGRDPGSWPVSTLKPTPDPLPFLNEPRPRPDDRRSTDVAGRGGRSTGARTRTSACGCWSSS